MTQWFVSRHPGAVQWARQQCLPIDRFVPHLDTSQVQADDTVIGSLPVHLAADVCRRGAHYINLSLDVPEDWRGRELTESELRTCNIRLESFQVSPA